MATINSRGNVRVRCPGCSGALSTYEYREGATEFGAINRQASDGRNPILIQYRLYRCAGCGMGGLGGLRLNLHSHSGYPENILALNYFEPDRGESLAVPVNVPTGIRREFEEAQACRARGFTRASAALFRSVLDKTFRANGYDTKSESNLKKQIDAAAADGVLTASRQRRAHDEIRVLGNDVLHDDWVAVSDSDVALTHYYAQRILEDFYDDRDSVLAQLRAAGRTAEEDRSPSGNVT